MTSKTGGPAFPVDEHAWMRGLIGISTRDYFAAKAMQAILSDPNYVSVDKKLAEQSYNVADAMLEARES